MILYLFLFWCSFFFCVSTKNKTKMLTKSPVWILTADWKSHTHTHTQKKSWSFETWRPQCLNFFERERERYSWVGDLRNVFLLLPSLFTIGWGQSLFLDCQNLSFSSSSSSVFLLDFDYYSGCFTLEESCECRPNLFSPWFDCPVSSSSFTLSLVRARSCNSSGSPFKAKRLRQS